MVLSGNKGRGCCTPLFSVKVSQRVGRVHQGSRFVYLFQNTVARSHRAGASMWHSQCPVFQWQVVTLPFPLSCLLWLTALASPDGNRYCYYCCCCYLVAAGIKWGTSPTILPITAGVEHLRGLRACQKWRETPRLPPVSCEEKTQTVKRLETPSCCGRWNNVRQTAAAGRSAPQLRPRREMAAGERRQRLGPRCRRRHEGARWAWLFSSGLRPPSSAEPGGRQRPVGACRSLLAARAGGAGRARPCMEARGRFAKAVVNPVQTDPPRFSDPPPVACLFALELNVSNVCLLSSAKDWYGAFLCPCVSPWRSGRRCPLWEGCFPSLTGGVKS